MLRIWLINERSTSGDDWASTPYLQIEAAAEAVDALNELFRHVAQNSPESPIGGLKATLTGPPCMFDRKAN